MVVFGSKRIFHWSSQQPSQPHQIKVSNFPTKIISFIFLSMRQILGMTKLASKTKQKQSHKIKIIHVPKVSSSVFIPSHIHTTISHKCICVYFFFPINNRFASVFFFFFVLLMSFSFSGFCHLLLSLIVCLRSPITVFFFKCEFF